MAVTFTDGVNPLPGATFVSFFPGTATSGTASASGYLDENGSISPTLTSGNPYTAVFSGAQAPSSTVALTWQASNFSVTVPNYASPSLSQTGFTQEEAAVWVRGAFGDAARTVGGNAYNVTLGVTSPLAALNTQVQAVKIAERLESCTGSEIDSWAADFFGSTLPRNAGETDSAYIGRIEANLSARKGTVAGLETIGGFYGTTTVVEPWIIGQTGACDSPTLGCDSIEGCVGSQIPDVSVFVQYSPAETWNPNDKNADITLSGGNLTATTATTLTYPAIRASLGMSSGKWYWETKMTVAGAPNNITGVGTLAASLSQAVGLDAYGWGYYGYGAGYKTHSGATLYGTGFGVGDVIGIALDMTDGTLTFYKNGVSQGVAFTGLTGTLYPMINLQDAGDSTTANFGATAFAYTPPTGYQPIGTMLATVATQAALSIAGAKPAGVTVNAFEVVGTTATPLTP